MTKIKSGFLSLLAGVGLLTALPGVMAETPAAAAASKASNACFYGRNADGFSVKDDRTVYVRAGIKDVYQLTLFSPCIDIDWAHHIALKSHGGDFICEGTNVDYEIFSPSVIGRQRCQVSSVRKLTADEVAAMPKKDRP
ncbi:DUF6491 family protein [Caulobacter sp. KR2-114]|uniref:DUF6491 family protein n=1 Tax=Caulobacter sp. KR2-114 TaxID=3400912 RepID=UPI003BFE3C89